MQFPYHALIGLSLNIPIPPPSPVFSYSPVVLSAPGRPVDLQVRVSAPPTGEDLPILLLSHGLGNAFWLNSLEGLTSLADFYAGHGFVVIQPTHLNAPFLGLNDTPPGQELWWQSMARDQSHILDQLDAVEDTVPAVAGRLDHDRVAVVGHSFGAYAAALLLGTTNTDPRSNVTVDMRDERIQTGVILSSGGDSKDMTAAGKAVIPWYGPDFGGMVPPAMVVYGDEDKSPEQTTRGPRWHADPYFLSPGPKDLLRIKGGMHLLGGVFGWDAAGTEDESPQRLESVRRMTWAYLRSHLYPEDDAWEKAKGAFQDLLDLGAVHSKH